jgi:hypothetical protein
MQKIDSTQALHRAIIILEHRRIIEEELFKEQFTKAYESLKPFNILRKAINDLTTSSEFKNHLFQTIAGVISGYLSRNLVIRTSPNRILRIVGIFVQYVVTQLITKNSEAIVKIGLTYFYRLFNSTRKN